MPQPGVNVGVSERIAPTLHLSPSERDRTRQSRPGSNSRLCAQARELARIHGYQGASGSKVVAGEVVKAAGVVAG